MDYFFLVMTAVSLGLRWSWGLPRAACRGPSGTLLGRGWRRFVAAAEPKPEPRSAEIAAPMAAEFSLRTRRCRHEAPRWGRPPL